MALRNGRTFGAEVAKWSPELDLALLRLRDAEEPPAASVGDSDALQLGKLVYVIGLPWGNPGAVTACIVGGFGVSVEAGRWRRRGSETRFIRPNVVLAQGDSDMPLLNVRGEVVEINAMILVERLQDGEDSVSLRVMRGGAVSVVEMPLEISGCVA